MTAAKKASAKKAAPKKATGTKKGTAKKDGVKKATPKKAVAAKGKPDAKPALKKAAQKKKETTPRRGKPSKKEPIVAKEKKAAKTAKPKASKSAKAVAKQVAEERPVKEEVATANEVSLEKSEQVIAKPRSSKRRAPASAAVEVQEYFPIERHPKLGFKFVCFACNTKFYDLNKPQAICPKCSADQADRPKVAVEKPKKVQRKSKPPMASLLAEEESIDMLPDDISPREPDLLEDSDIEPEAVFGEDAEFEIEEEEEEEPDDNFF